MDRRPPPDLTLCFNRSMRRSSLRLVGLYEKAMAPSGLQTLEFSLLTQIKEAGTAGIAELAESFFLERATLRYKLAPLQRAGYIVFVADTRDRRTRRVRITEKGLQVLGEAAGLWETAQKRFEAVLGKEQARTLKAAADIVASSTFAEAFTGV